MHWVYNFVHCHIMVLVLGIFKCDIFPFTVTIFVLFIRRVILGMLQEFSLFKSGNTFCPNRERGQQKQMHLYKDQIIISTDFVPQRCNFPQRNKWHVTFVRILLTVGQYNTENSMCTIPVLKEQKQLYK